MQNFTKIKQKLIPQMEWQNLKFLKSLQEVVNPKTQANNNPAMCPKSSC
jgi:hypothetical protein